MVDSGTLSVDSKSGFVDGKARFHEAYTIRRSVAERPQPIAGPQLPIVPVPCRVTAHRHALGRVPRGTLPRLNLDVVA